MSTKSYACLDTNSFYANCQAKHLNIKLAKEQKLRIENKADK